MSRVVAQKYRLLYELGRGGMGSVWAAEHVVLGVRVAVKLIDRPFPSGELRRRFELEARAAAALRSPHAAQVFDYGVENNTPYLVMELLDGRSLAQRLSEEERLSPSAVWTVVCHVVHAMDRAHATGFVHRDLKPDNIFFVDTADLPLVKVLDFGVAKALAGRSVENTRAGALMGTPAYASPEQVEGRTVDPRSDLWSIGVICFECLTGLLPFSRATLPELFGAICREPIVVPSDVADVPEGFDEWFARAAARDVTERFQTAQQLREGLRPILGPGVVRRSYGPLAPSPTARAPTSALHLPTFTDIDEALEGPLLPSVIPAGIDGKRDLRHAAILRDTIPSGATLLTRSPFRPGQPLVLSLYIENAELGLWVNAHVTRVEPHDGGLFRYRVYIRFDEPLSDDVLGRLAQKARARVEDRGS